MCFKNWINKVFKHEEINGGERCPTYLFRWTLLRTRWFAIYIHHFVGDDWSLDYHDHPKRFVSIGLWGRYIEETPSDADGHWETVVDDDGEMIRIRWSVPDAQGRYSWVRHYPATTWSIVSCEQQAARWNAEKSGPTNWPGDFVPQPIVRSREYRAPWIRTFPAEHIHRIRAAYSGGAWTLVWVGIGSRPWGFWRDGLWIHWKEYVFGKDARSSCGEGGE